MKQDESAARQNVEQQARKCVRCVVRSALRRTEDFADRAKGARCSVPCGHRIPQTGSMCIGSDEPIVIIK